MIIYVDIDGTIANTVKDANYENATPIRENIEKINSLYDEGHRIVYWTARGGTTGIDWRDVTEKQLKEWGVKYHDLESLKKPYYDLFIDDKAINASRINEIGQELSKCQPIP
jgi:histidinol phosphatase-like enzyme